MTSPSLSIVSKTGSPVSLLTSRVMCLSTISRRTLARDDVDELLAGKDARDVLVVKHPLGAGQAKRGAGDDHRFGQRRRRVARCGR